MTVPPDFAWRQSTVGELLRCPRRFKLRHVDKVPVDHVVSGFAAPLGTADHAAIEVALRRANAGETATRGELVDAAIEGFQAAIHRAQDQGEHLDDEGVERALGLLEGERADRLERLARDPRIHAIDWRGIEHPFDFRERAGRRWHGTIDAWGVAKHRVERWSSSGRRGFIGQVADLAVPKAPTDSEGKRIPKKLPKRLNPAYRNALLAAGVQPLDVAKSRKRAKDADGKVIPKWLDPVVNPAWLEARALPKGPFIREVVVDFPLVLGSVRDAVRLADEGIFPASGALTGQCARCPFSHVCTSNPEQS